MTCTRLALVGCGHWGSNLLRTAARLPDAEVQAVLDPSPHACAAARGIAPGVETGASLELLRSLRPDAVLIASPGPLHAQHALAALEAGAHVFVEKPLAMCVDDAVRVADAARAAGRIGMVGHLLHYHPSVRTLLALLSAGALGSLLTLRTTRCSPAGSRDPDGSVLWSLLPHDVSLLRAVDPSALASLTVHRASAASLSVELRTEAGLQATMSARRDGEKKVRRVELTGTRGTLVFDDTLASGKLRVGEDLVAHDDSEPALQLELKAFLSAVRTGLQPATSLQEGVAVVSVLAQCARSVSV